jgi:hypothetical protein
MTIYELYSHLHEEGYAALLRRYATGVSVLDFDIERDGEIIRICEKERGQTIHIYLETDDESAACVFYLDRVSSEFQHLIGAPDADHIAQLQALLEAAGIAAKRSELPGYLGLTNTRYRLSVAGSDLKRSQTLLGL